VTSLPSRSRRSGRIRRRSACASDAIFIARHGSWNKTHKIGGDIVVALLNPDGTVRSIEPFITGFLVDNKYLGRPVDMEWLKDGSMLLSDDFNGAVYRISYGPAHQAAR
jgi:glucose/arabinose dehydrogenase